MMTGDPVTDIACAIAALVACVVLHFIQEARWNAQRRRWHREHPGRRGVLK